MINAHALCCLPSRKCFHAIKPCRDDLWGAKENCANIYQWPLGKHGGIVAAFLYTQTLCSSECAPLYMDTYTMSTCWNMYQAGLKTNSTSLIVCLLNNQSQNITFSICSASQAPTRLHTQPFRSNEY